MTTNTTERDALEMCPKCGRMKPRKHNCFDDPLIRTANASEASEPVAWRVQKSDGTGWYLTSDANEAQHMRENRLLQVQSLYAAPPSDRAAVEGVTADALTAAFLNERLAQAALSKGHRVIWALTPEDVTDAFAERARASDTNAAAAPVGQAVAYMLLGPAGVEGYRELTAASDDGSIPTHLQEPVRKIAPGFAWHALYTAPPTPSAAYRQPTIEDARNAADMYMAEREKGNPFSVSMLAALNSIGARIPEDGDGTEVSG
jgi:hypothetical protein